MICAKENIKNIKYSTIINSAKKHNRRAKTTTKTTTETETKRFWSKENKRTLVCYMLLHDTTCMHIKYFMYLYIFTWAVYGKFLFDSGSRSNSKKNIEIDYHNLENKYKYKLIGEKQQQQR